MRQAQAGTRQYRGHYYLPLGTLRRSRVQVIIETKAIGVPYPGGDGEITVSREEPKAEEEKTA